MLGINFCPSWISGLTDGPLVPCSLAYATLVRGLRWLPRTTELMGSRGPSSSRSGTTNDVWYVPILPVSAFRARNFRTYLPGRSVKPASYWIGLDASRFATPSFNSISTLSRRFVTMFPDSFLTSPMKSITVRRAPPSCACISSLLGIWTASGTKYAPPLRRK